MPYRDQDKQREAGKERARRYRALRKGVTLEGKGVTKGERFKRAIKAHGTPKEGFTSLDTPEAIKGMLATWNPLIDEHGHADPGRLKAHQEEIRRKWCRPGNWNAAYQDLAPKMGWGKR